MRAAQYVRMSTDHQRYSVLNQMEVIAEYAKHRGVQIVCTYADRGKSGLDLKDRPALQQLLEHVVSGAASYSLILVYDVSRWGRFQDADEAAHYEFVCRQAGINVEYCAEQFANDGDPVAALLKSMKRIMAAQYSRDLSNRVHYAQSRVAAMGYRVGGSAGIGYRRLVIDEIGKQEIVLETGQHKIVATGRTTLVPGPPHEVEIVRYIFRESASGTPNKVIANNLNRQGRLTPRGKLWTRHTVTALLKNEKYIGTNIWNKRSAKLRERRKYNPKSEWVRVDEAFKPIISRELYEESRRAILRRRKGVPEKELLDGLRRLLREKGRLTRELIAADKRLHSPVCYSKRFGGVLNAYKRIGYVPEKRYHNNEVDQFVRRKNELNAQRAAEKIQRLGMSLEFRRTKRSFVVNGEIAVLFTSARSYRFKRTGERFWQMVPRFKTRIDIIVLARMDHENREIVDYLLLPKELVREGSIRMYEAREHPFYLYQSDTLEPLYAVLASFDRDTPIQESIIEAIRAATEQRRWCS